MKMKRVASNSVAGITARNKLNLNYKCKSASVQQFGTVEVVKKNKSKKNKRQQIADKRKETEVKKAKGNKDFLEKIFSEQEIMVSELRKEIETLKHKVKTFQIFKEFTSLHVSPTNICYIMEHRDEHTLGPIANTPKYCTGGTMDQGLAPNQKHPTYQLNCSICSKKCTTYCMQCFWFYELPGMHAIHETCKQAHIDSLVDRCNVPPFLRKGRAEVIE